jgi:hypothetical protein
MRIEVNRPFHKGGEEQGVVGAVLRIGLHFHFYLSKII